MSLRCPLSFMETKASLHRASGQTEMSSLFFYVPTSCCMCVWSETGTEKYVYTDQVVSDDSYQFSRIRVTIRATLSAGSVRFPEIITSSIEKTEYCNKILERKHTYVAMQLVTDMM
jgi:hypothetical protein